MKEDGWQLEKLGYQIEQKPELGGEDEFLASETDSTWMEGNPKLVTHWKRERSKRLAKKKKADFIIYNNFKELNVKRNVRIIKSKILKNERNYT